MTIKTAVYLRISKDEEMTGLAIDRHREDCHAIIQARGWEIHGEYVDHGVPSRRHVRRPAYERMVEDYQRGYFGAIVCWDLDRLTRVPAELEDWIELAEERGLQIVTANGEADLGTDGGRLYARIRASVARAEVERKGARQSRAQRQRAELGRPPRGRRPLGYTIDGDVIPDEAEVVRAMYSALLAGWSIRDVARALNGEEGGPPEVSQTPRHTHTLAVERNRKRQAAGLEPGPVPAPGGWRPTSLHPIYRNGRYAGYSTYVESRSRGADHVRRGGDRIVRDEHGQPVRGQWDPIVDEATWWAVQDLLDDPRRRSTRQSGTHRRHLGVGLYICGECGGPMRSHSGDRYRCAACGLMRSIGQVDTYVTAVIQARLRRDDVAELLAREDQDEAGGGGWSERIREAEARIARVQRDYDDGILEAADLRRVRDAARAEIAEAERERLAAVSSRQVGRLLAAADPGEAFDALELPERREVLRALCRVTLHRGTRVSRRFDPDTVEVSWVP